MRRIELIGIVGERVELKTTSNGTDILNFSVVANTSRKDDDGQWHSCALFGARASKLAEFVKKGKKVFVRGEYKLRKWESNGKNGVDVDVSVDEIELLTPKEKDSSPSVDPPNNW